jgi:UDP-N-acetylmuramate dehydrogenase
MTPILKMAEMKNIQWDKLYSSFGERIQEDVPLSRFTAARVGGEADALIVVDSKDLLVETINFLWEVDIPFFLLGGGSNILISDYGFRGVVILNHVKGIEIKSDSLLVEASSGASFGQMARKICSRGFGGFEWATGIPGTVGGAVYGNAGAHGSDVASCLYMAEILHRGKGIEEFSPEEMLFSYRSSVLKRKKVEGIVLAAKFQIDESSEESTRKLVERYTKSRKESQPPGASMGSMFKNPPGDYAGRLIEAVGLKNTQIGGASISPLHANFFITSDNASADDVFRLIKIAKHEVYKKFGIELELEIELIGEWDNPCE